MATGFPEVDQTIEWFARETQATLGAQFIGMYVYGSLALGDFDSLTSDIDFVVVTHTRLTSHTIAVLTNLHARFDRSSSVWSGRIEAAYVEQAALSLFPPSTTAYPQVETGRGMATEPLELGWIVQCWTLRECGIVIVGPPPTTLIPTA